MLRGLNRLPSPARAHCSCSTLPLPTLLPAWCPVCADVYATLLTQWPTAGSHINNDYELTFGRETQVEMVADDAGMAKQVYDFVDFANLEAMPKENAYVDVCAMVRPCPSKMCSAPPLRLPASPPPRLCSWTMMLGASPPFVVYLSRWHLLGIGGGKC